MTRFQSVGTKVILSASVYFIQSKGGFTAFLKDRYGKILLIFQKHLFLALTLPNLLGTITRYLMNELHIVILHVKFTRTVQ
jgi:hypothetical protein